MLCIYYLDGLAILPADSIQLDEDRSSLNNSSSDALEKESSRAPAAVPAAISGACCPGLQAKTAVLLISSSLFTILFFSRKSDLELRYYGNLLVFIT